MKSTEIKIKNNTRNLWILSALQSNYINLQKKE